MNAQPFPAITKKYLPENPAIPERQSPSSNIHERGVATAPESPAGAGLSVQRSEAGTPYIMPSIPPMPPGGIPAGPLSFFGFSATVASVVISNPAIDAAF